VLGSEKNLEVLAVQHRAWSDRLQLTSDSPRRLEPGIFFGLIGNRARGAFTVFWDAGVVIGDERRIPTWTAEIEALIGAARRRLGGIVVPPRAVSARESDAHARAIPRRDLVGRPHARRRARSSSRAAPLDAHRYSARRSRMSNRRYLLCLTALFAGWWALLAIAPYDRAAWRVQNVGILVLFVALALSRRRMSFSRVSYTFLFVYLCLLAVGAHYTYARTPYDEWFISLTGRSLNSWVGWERNNFDRIVHFAYGLLVAYPARELFLRIADVRGFWGYFLPLDVVMSTSMIFELIEWVTAAVFGGGDPNYIGMQGDVWDTQKDMALATLGALLALCVIAAVNARYHRDFAREWNESVRVKRREATDPDGLAWLAHRRK